MFHAFTQTMDMLQLVDSISIVNPTPFPPNLLNSAYACKYACRDPHQTHTWMHGYLWTKSACVHGDICTLLSFWYMHIPCTYHAHIYIHKHSVQGTLWDVQPIRHVCKWHAHKETYENDVCFSFFNLLVLSLVCFIFQPLDFKHLGCCYAIELEAPQVLNNKSYLVLLCPAFLSLSWLYCYLCNSYFFSAVAFFFHCLWPILNHMLCTYFSISKCFWCFVFTLMTFLDNIMHKNHHVRSLIVRTNTSTISCTELIRGVKCWKWRTNFIPVPREIQCEEQHPCYQSKKLKTIIFKTSWIH